MHWLESCRLPRDPRNPGFMRSSRAPAPPVCKQGPGRHSSSFTYQRCVLLIQLPMACFLERSPPWLGGNPFFLTWPPIVRGVPFWGVPVDAPLFSFS